MNLLTLKEAETAFFDKFPHGFEHPELVAIAKKHRMPQMVTQAQDVFAESAFDDTAAVLENMTKMISRSSLVSLFEKPKFRDMAKILSGPEREVLVQGLRQFLYGDQDDGFNDMVSVLASHKLAKWSLMTVIPNYVFPLREIFIKPTTAKGVIRYFELEDLTYKPMPTWAFYHQYRMTIERLKAEVDPELAPSNAAFCGFLMMSLPEDMLPKRPKRPEKKPS